MAETTEEKKEKDPGQYEPTDREKKLISKWDKRFKLAERTRKPYEAKNLRMWYLYRAYRAKTNYAYKTSLMPPIGFEIVETVKPRLAAARMRTRLFPVSKDDANSDSIGEWDDLINYQFDEMDIEEKKSDWIDSMLKYGNGYAVMGWGATIDEEGKDDGNPTMDIDDNWLLYFDPTSGPRLKDSGWEIRQIFRRKERIEKEEEKRSHKEKEEDEEGNPVIDEETGEAKETEIGKLYHNLEFVKNQKQNTNDPRKERYEIETLKMGQIYTPGNANTDDKSDDTQTSVTDEKDEEESVELWECYDHEEDEIVTIANRQVVIRDEESPYKGIYDGRMIVDLACIRVPWSAYAMSILEPVETTIHEIADSRNQAMDDIIFNLDPIRKVRKGANIDKDSIVVEPGAMWELANVDDVVIERGTGIDRAWIDKDDLLRREIQTSLAMSEYVRGIPGSAQEPGNKVELLLMQTSIRFSQFVRNLEMAMADVVNIMIELNRSFLPESKVYRLLGDDVDFKEFKSKEVKVDARVEIEPKPELTPDQRKAEALGLYKVFVADDAPDVNDPNAVNAFKKKKRALQKMILDEHDKSSYANVLVGPEEKLEQAAAEGQAVADAGTTVEAPASPDIPNTPETIPPIEALASLPGASTPQTAPRANLISRFLQNIRR